MDAGLGASRRPLRTSCASARAANGDVAVDSHSMAVAA
jgi:hypothetical protein